MSKKRQRLLKYRLDAANRFIRELARRSEDYGSEFSSEVFHDCTNFLRDNKPLRESRTIVLPLRRYNDLLGFQRETLFARKAKASA